MNSYKIYNGNCFDVLKGIGDNSVDLIVTDPPYIISRETNFSKGGGDESKYGCISMQFGTWDNTIFDIKQMLTDFNRILKRGGSMIIFFDIFKMQLLNDYAAELNLKQPRIGVWNKINAVPINANVNYLSNAREYFISFTKGIKKTFNSYYDKGFYDLPIVSGKERTKHPTQKPVALIQEIIRVNSNKGDIVLDPFMGSGTTGVASLEIDRDFIGVELDKEYYEIAEKRLRNTKQNKIQSLFD